MLEASPAAVAAPNDFPFSFIFADTYTIQCDPALDVGDVVPLEADADFLKWRDEFNALQAEWRRRNEENEAAFAASDAAERRYRAKYPEADDDAVNAYILRWMDAQLKQEQRAKEPKKPPQSLPRMRRYVFIRASGAYYDLMTRSNCAVNTVHLMCRNMMPVAYPGGMAAFMMDGVKSYDRLAYAPDKPKTFTDAAGLECLNIYQSSGLYPFVGSVMLWLDHVHKFFGDDVVAREHFLDWLAFKLQNPARKVRHGVILHSCQGAGKGVMAKPLFAILGENAVAPDNTELIKGQMGFLENRLMVIVHELKAENNRFVADKLKPCITEETTRIEYKYANPYRIENPASVLCFTNWENALFLEDSDRRWFLYSSAMKPETQDYYKRLHDWIDGDGSAHVYRFLLDRDVTGFNPDAHPPMTVAKQQTIEASRGETRNGLLELWQDRKAPFELALVNLKAATTYLKQEFPKLGTEALKRFLREQGAQPFSPFAGSETGDQVRYKRKGVTVKERLWLLRGHSADWQGKSQEEIGEAVWQPPFA